VVVFDTVSSTNYYHLFLQDLGAVFPFFPA
jgi:hypothetical protein